jgi:hypothetical protein
MCLESRKVDQVSFKCEGGNLIAIFSFASGAAFLIVALILLRIDRIWGGNATI